MLKALRLGPRTPLLLISGRSKINFVDHTLTDQSSITRFVEDNWLGSKRLGAGSFDTIAGTINLLAFHHLAFHHQSQTRLTLNPGTGQPIA